MAAGEKHALPLVKGVRAGSLHAGIQVQLAAGGFAREFVEPGKQRAAMAVPLPIGAGNEIVHVKEFATREMFAEAKTGHRRDLAMRLEKNEVVAVALLTPDDADEGSGPEMRPQFTEHGKAAANVLRGLGNMDGSGLCHVDLFYMTFKNWHVGHTWAGA